MCAKTESSGPSNPSHPPIADYQSALRYLYRHIDLERARIVAPFDNVFKLDRTQRLLEHMGNPHRQIRTVHIAGTKGKGSTAAMLAAAVQGCGLTVGCYTSPHLVDVRERITLNNNTIPETDFARLIVQISSLSDRLGFEHELHFFEILTVMGLAWFAEQAVDLAVIETGLGGRLDSTNVIMPEVSIITHISLDHTHVLGGTLPEIAREKAGILKAGVPAISAAQDEAVEQVLRERAAEVGTTLAVMGTDYEYSSRIDASSSSGRLAGRTISIRTAHSVLESVPVPLMGAHQAMNCALALAAVDHLIHQTGGLPLDIQQAIAGLDRTHLEGRLEVVQTRPYLVLDGAHNPASIEVLVETISNHFKCDSLAVVFGCGRDKDAKSMLRSLTRLADKFILTRTTMNPKAHKPEDLRDLLAELSPHSMCMIAETPAEALRLACGAATSRDLICVTGSFYLIGDIKQHLLKTAQDAAGSDRTAP
ncbi:MAG: bifunctional folylpolyglutamate synthase/dihydrofolate synthase [Planctomycetes bacterium]|nr:bifunctional folylpolyglutamate synthase/dihydrofolate synthase [Planctomycetota bacterium]NOG55730.1 bifunctional folylpolyglutamate synthase/dihydrofolate synthase [Planctomycetota bacterium]